MSVRTLSQQKLSSNYYDKLRSLRPKGSAYFDGTGDYVKVFSSSALAFGTGSYTVEMWIRPETRSTSEILISGIAPGWGWRLGTGYNANAMAGMSIFNAGSGDYESCSHSFTAQQWYHIAVVRQSGSSVKFYVNGTEKTTSGTSSVSTNWGAESGLAIGAYSGGGEDYFGYISNLRIVKSAIYTSNFTVPTSPLTAVANTSLLTVNSPTTLADSSTNNWTVTAYGNAAVSATNPF